MVMDNEQQVRFNFLEEAEEYIDRIESVLLDLSAVETIIQPLDEALRAAHSLKGGAATMGFIPMSQIAHRLEDFLKILRVRPEAQQQIATVEILLLQGVDALRKVRNLHRNQVNVTETWLSQNAHPIFSQLQASLGELREEDDHALMIQEDGNEAALLLFEDGVESAIEALSEEIGTVSGEHLRQTLDSNAQLLAEFGRMAQLDDFVALCQKIQQGLSATPNEEIEPFAQRTLVLWERSQGMVLLGQEDKLSGLLGLLNEPTPQQTDELDGEFIPRFDTATDDALVDPFELDAVPDFHTTERLPIEETVVLESPGLDLNSDELGDSDFPVDEVQVNELLLADNTNVQFDLDNQTRETLAPSVLPSQELSQSLKSAMSQAALAFDRPKTTIEQPSLSSKSDKAGKGPPRTIRVSVDELRQFNSLFGELILERNTINLRLEQLQKTANLMRQRILQLQQSNIQLRKWYDRATLENVIAPTEEHTVSSPPSPFSITSMPIQGAADPISEFQKSFDVLEMDQYTDLNLLSQDQIETIVQLQEVSADLDLGLREISQAASNLNQTTRALQTNVTRTQMRPIADILKRFPRMVKDLSRKYDKPAHVEIEGDNTLLDRAILETLGDPIRHIVRNAFDHGLEDADTRAASGKPPQGTIKISARHRGNQSTIQIQDDGSGINFDKIRDRALQMGFQPDLIQESSEADLMDLIFEPGFSTAQNITDISGRGVGMDAVRTTIQSIRGSIAVESKAGRGTTFTINVPFMLAVVRVMILETARMVFALPADSVKEVIRLNDSTLKSDTGTEQLQWRDQRVPLIRVERHYTYSKTHRPFKMEGSPKVKHPIALLIHQHESLGGLYVERIWREEEVTTTPIQSLFSLPVGFNSATILGDGRVIPILDPIALLEFVQTDQGTEQWQTDGADREQVSYPESTPKNRILVVDDSINVRRYLAMTLEKAGYEVEQSKDGKEALTMLMDGLKVNAIISDIEMPRLDGYGLLSELRSHPDFETLPIAMLTSRNSDRHRKLAMKLGASAYIAKPFTETDFLQTLNEIITTP